MQVKTRPHGDEAAAVLVAGHVHDAACGKVGVERHILPSEGGLLRIQHLDEVVGQDVGLHADGDAACTLDHDHGDLGGEDDGLLVASVVGVHVLRDLGRVEDLLRKEPALDVTSGRGAVSGELVAEVALVVDEQVVVGKVDQRVVDRGVPVRVVLHALSDNVGHLVELAVVHLDQGVYDPPLHRLEPILELGDRPVAYDVRGVLDEVLLEDTACVCHQTRFSMMYSLRSGVLLPM